MGPSGSGKSTLLYILGALEPPTSGTVTLDGRNPFDLRERDQAAFRNKHIGFVFQDHSLLPQCSVLENVLAPTFVAPPADAGPAAATRAQALLTQVGLADPLAHRPAELSSAKTTRRAARALFAIRRFCSSTNAAPRSLGGRRAHVAVLLSSCMRPATDPVVSPQRPAPARFP